MGAVREDCLVKDDGDSAALILSIVCSNHRILPIIVFMCTARFSIYLYNIILDKLTRKLSMQLLLPTILLCSLKLYDMCFIYRATWEHVVF